VEFQVEQSGVASVNARGVLRALQPGSTGITVSSPDGKFSDTLQLTVTPAAPRYRALLVSEENYPFAEDTRREGSALQEQAGTVEDGVVGQRAHDAPKRLKLVRNDVQRKAHGRLPINGTKTGDEDSGIPRFHRVLLYKTHADFGTPPRRWCPK